MSIDFKSRTSVLVRNGYALMRMIHHIGVTVLVPKLFPSGRRAHRDKQRKISMITNPDAVDDVGFIYFQKSDRSLLVAMPLDLLRSVNYWYTRCGGSIY